MSRPLAALLFFGLLALILQPALRKDPSPAPPVVSEPRPAPAAEAPPAALPEPEPQRTTALPPGQPEAPSQLVVTPLAPSEECVRLAQRVRELEYRLALVDGPVQKWKGFLRPGEVPDEATLRTMSLLLANYPIDLRVEEGLWVAERVRLDDWKSWGPTIDEALVAFLGPERLKRELGEERYNLLLQ